MGLSLETSVPVLTVFLQGLLSFFSPCVLPLSLIHIFLQNGHVVQCDKPENILKHPANEYINSFIGKNRLWENPSFIRAEDIMRPRPITISQSRTVVQAVQLLSLIHI